MKASTGTLARRAWRRLRRTGRRLLRALREDSWSEPAESDQGIIDQFHRLYFHTRHIEGVKDTWLGVPVMKYPGDLMVYQELIYELRPDYVIETGANAGGSALFYASICDLIGHGEVISIDLKPPERVKHPRIHFLTGDSTEEKTVGAVAEFVGSRPNALVTLDSNHTRNHVLREMELYCRFVPVGGYLVVEDTKLNGHPVETSYTPDRGPGPMEALEAFLEMRDDFVPDRQREKFLLTSQPRGFLRRKR